jgi:hypothetical protein
MTSVLNNPDRVSDGPTSLGPSAPWVPPVEAVRNGLEKIELAGKRAGKRRPLRKRYARGPLFEDRSVTLLTTP